MTNVLPLGSLLYIHCHSGHAWGGPSERGLWRRRGAYPGTELGQVWVHAPAMIETLTELSWPGNVLCTLS